jgi:hypothetical protein
MSSTRAVVPPQRPRRRLLVLLAGLGVAALVVVVVSLSIIPRSSSCAVPWTASGTECLQRVDYRFETVPGPGESGSSAVSFGGDQFELWHISSNATDGVPVNATEPSGAHGSVGLVDCCLLLSGWWQTSLSHDAEFGAQSLGLNVSEVRLLVRD